LGAPSRSRRGGWPARRHPRARAESWEDVHRSALQPRVGWGTQEDGTRSDPRV